MKTTILIMATLMALIAIESSGKKKVKTHARTPITLSSHTIGVKDTVVIRMVQHGSSGYCWVWKNRKQARVVDSVGVSTQPINPNTRMIGAPVYSLWTFKGMKPGVDTLLLEEMRVFEKNSTINTRKVVIRVK